MEDLPLLPEKDFSVSCTNLHKKSNLLFAIGTYKPSVRIYNLALQSILLNRNLLEYPLAVLSLDGLNKYYILTKNCLEVHSKHGLFKNIKMSFCCRNMTFFKDSLLIIGNKPFIKMIDKKNKIKEDFKLKITPICISSFNDCFAVCDEEGIFIYKNFKLIFEKKFDSEITSLLLIDDYVYVGNIDGELLKVNIFSHDTNLVYKVNDSINLVKEKNDFVIFSLNKKLIILKEKIVKEIELDNKINSFELDDSILFIASDNGEIIIYNIKELGNSPEWCRHILNE